MGKYLKAAFLNRWNLLTMIGGVTFSLLSGHPDVFLPLLLAGEAAYLGFVSSHPKFRNFVDFHKVSASRKQRERANESLVRRMLRALPPDSRDRFEQLRRRCLDLQKIAADLRRSARSTDPPPLHSLQLADLDRLMWIFLRLLFTHHSLSQFLDQTDAGAIQNDVERLEHRLQLIDENDTSDHATKMRRAIEDNLQTCRDRLGNYEKARANHEFLELEIDRLGNKIKSLSELAVNRHDHDFVVEQVDRVTHSMVETEKTMNELEFATGVGDIDTEAPPLMREGTRVYD